MKLYRFDNSGVTETAFASDRDDLEDLLVDNFGADLSKLAEEYDLTEEAYLLAWSEVDPSESLTVSDESGENRVTQTVAEWTAEWMATEGKRGLFTSSEV